MNDGRSREKWQIILKITMCGDTETEYVLLHEYFS